MAVAALLCTLSLLGWAAVCGADGSVLRMFIITPYSRKLDPGQQMIRQTLISIHFRLVRQWLIIHNDKEEDFKPIFAPEAKLFSIMFHGRGKILEAACKVESSINGNAQRNMGLEILAKRKEQGLVYFLDADNVVHPNLWQLMTSMPSGYIYTVDQFRIPPNRVLSGKNVKVTQIDTAQFVFDLQLMGDLRFKNISEYAADGIFAEDLIKAHGSKHIYLPFVAAFYNYGKQNFSLAMPTEPIAPWP